MIKLFPSRNFHFVLFLIALVFSIQLVNAQINADATTKTKALYSNLKVIEQSNRFLFGQEFFNSFRYNSGSAHGDETFSDAKDITGSHPAVLGSDFHYYLEKNDTERGYHTEAVKYAFQQGYVVTFDWHLSARNTTSYACSGSPANLAKNIANGNTNGDRDWYIGELDKVIEIINQDLVVGNDTIPIVFRPLHEMNGSWFWWGACSGLTATEYKSLYQFTVNYIKERTKSVLFCWSPNSPFQTTHYPGDEYVDLVGVDLYEATTTSLRNELGKVVDFAQEHNKVAVFSETGDRNSDATAGLYWKNVVLPGILNDPTGKSKKIAWVLTWINSSWSEPYVPHNGSSSTVKQSFTDFKNTLEVIFGDESEMPAMYTAPTVVGVEDLNEVSFSVYPNPTTNKLIVSFTSSDLYSIRLYNTTGSLVLAEDDVRETLVIPLPDNFAPGVYWLKISVQGKSIGRKIIVY